MSWAGKILRVNLTEGPVRSEPLNMEWARQYIGSRGLAKRRDQIKHELGDGGIRLCGLQGLLRRAVVGVDVGGAAGA